MSERSLELKTNILKSKNEIKQIKENKKDLSKDDIIRIVTLLKYIEIDEEFLALEELKINKNM